MAATDWSNVDVSSEIMCQMMRDLNRLEYRSEIPQTVWYKYADDGTPTSLGTPDAGVSIPSLNALGDEWYRAKYIADIRASIEGLLEADMLHDIADWKRYSLGEPDIPAWRKSLYELAAPRLDYRWAYDATTQEQRYTWFIPTIQLLNNADYYYSDEAVPVLVSQHFYDMFISEIFECVKILKAAATAIHITVDGTGNGASWDDPISFEDANTLADGYAATIKLNTPKPRFFMAGGVYELPAGANGTNWEIIGGFDGELIPYDLASVYTPTKFDGLDDAWFRIVDVQRCEFTGLARLTAGVVNDCHIHHNTWDWIDREDYPYQEYDAIFEPAGFVCQQIYNSLIEYNSVTLTRSEKLYNIEDQFSLLQGKFIPLAIGGCSTFIMDSCTVRNNYASGTASEIEATPGANGAQGVPGQFEAKDTTGAMYNIEPNDGECGCHALTVWIKTSTTIEHSITNCTFSNNRNEAISGTSGASGGNGGNGAPGVPAGSGGRGGQGGLGGSAAVVVAAHDVVQSGNVYTSNVCTKGEHGNGGDGGNAGAGGPQNADGGAGGDGAIGGDAGISNYSTTADFGRNYRSTIESSALYEKPHSPYDGAFVQRQAFWVPIV
jgi:hypothetical protein